MPRDLTAVIVFHGEQYIAPASLLSFDRCCSRAADAGLSVERVAIVDRPDQLTRQIVDSDTRGFDRVEYVDFGDLGQSRNAGRDIASGEYLAFFDGDDLWGEDWLHAGVEYLRKRETPAIAHPEVIYYFSADDYLKQSNTDVPRDGLKAFHFIQVASSDAAFDFRSIMFNNIWTANSLAHRGIYQNYPYLPVDRIQGFGVEDWTWNAETLASGLEHVVVPETVHCIRLKSEGSLSLQNGRERILPRIHAYADRLEALQNDHAARSVHHVAAFVGSRVDTV